MKDFLKKHKRLIAPAVIIAIFTILLCIPATLKILVGVFGYAAYFYLLVGYAFFVLACKNKRLPLTKKRFALYVASVVLLIMTLHVGLCGKALVESGAGGYIGGSYDAFTVGGVLFSILSLPVVLLCKFIAGVIIYFVATAICGFFLIAPLVFEHSSSSSSAQKKPVDEPTAKTENNSGAEKREETEAQEKTPVAPTAPLPEKGTKEYARRLLFGESEQTPDVPSTRPTNSSRKILFDDEKPSAEHTKFVEPKPDKPDVFSRGEDENAYRIIDGVDAMFVPPDITPYTNGYFNQREEAKKKLFDNRSADEDYAAISRRVSERTVEQELRDAMKANPYIPSRTVFEKEEPTDPVVTSSPAASATPTVEAPEAHVVNSDKEFGVDENGEIYDVLPTIADSPFAKAVRADKGDGAPVNVYSDEPPAKEKTTDVANDNKSETVAQEETSSRREEEGEPVIHTPKMAKPYVAPPVSLLQDHVKEGFSPYVDNFAELKQVFEVTLKKQNLDLKLIDVIKGPTVTLCVLDLADGYSINRVTALEKDIERFLKTPQGQKINILTKLPNSTYFGIEIPNAVKGIVSFKEIMASPEWNNAKGQLVLGLGKTNSGDIVVDDLADMPHALIAGSSGSGKSVCINAIIASLLYRYSPDELKLVLIDLKYVEMANFAELPHMLFKNPLNEVSEVINALNWLKTETQRRYMVFRDYRCRDIKEYNAKVPPEQKLPRIVIIIDEASELMTHPTGKKVMEATLSTLARVARAAGVHMLFATQTPSKEVITSEIQNNMTTKIAFAVSDYVQSQVIFKSPEAAKLLGKGDMMIKKPTGMLRAQCALVTTPEIDAIVDFIKQNNTVEFDDDAIDRILHGSKEEAPSSAPVEKKEVKPVPALLEKKNFDEDSGFQELVKEALHIFVSSGKVSATYIQRRFSKGYNTIANVMDYLEDKGYVSAPINNKRTLLITKEKFFELYPEYAEEEE